MSLAKKGDLLQYITMNGHLDTECTQFYAGEVLLALEHLHNLGIIHRHVWQNWFQLF